ncbi:hypothetical protein AVEN_105066-1 [Araneus ventricosus]|uniref:Uncharacterized protein n=1 Tax=Araneus ventricosus TaxID=182803 RepID=A0A4Y2V2A3_ARAVE|nr:hypothetical protein AVEN_105066-1 [Araneus ventricosus]
MEEIEVLPTSKSFLYIIPCTLTNEEIEDTNNTLLVRKGTAEGRSGKLEDLYNSLLPQLVLLYNHGNQTIINPMTTKSSQNPSTAAYGGSLLSVEWIRPPLSPSSSPRVLEEVNGRLSFYLLLQGP